MCSTCDQLLKMDKVPVENIIPRHRRTFFPKKAKKDKDEGKKDK